MATDDGQLGNGVPNRDPITGAPGAHPVGTGLGAAGGGLAGAAAGSLAGPIGTVVGLVAGAVVGGLGGKAAAEGVNPTAEEAYWRENHGRQPYAAAGRHFFWGAGSVRPPGSSRAGLKGDCPLPTVVDRPFRIP